MINQTKVLKKALIEIGATYRGNKPKVRVQTYIRRGDRYYGDASAHTDALNESQIKKLKEILPDAKIYNYPDIGIAMVDW